MLAGKNVPARIAVQVKHVQAEFRSDPFAEDQRIPEMVAGIQEEDQEVRPDAGGHVQQWNGLGLERRTHRDLRPEGINCPGQDLLRRLVFELVRKSFDLLYVQHGAQIITRYNRRVKAEIAQRLLALNRQFYTEFGESFSATRGRIQPGVRRILGSLRGDERMLDLGCGNGGLARALAKDGHRGAYLGLDFSPPLLSEAEFTTEGFSAQFREVDLTQLSVICDQLSATDTWELITAFAILHHIPGQNLRLSILKTIHALLAEGGRFIHSNWQFLNSPRLRQRISPWDEAGLTEADVDEGDYLLDWRSGGRGLRYVHHFEEGELAGLAASSGFRVIETFYSDGKEGNLAIYQVWVKA